MEGVKISPWKLDYANSGSCNMMEGIWKRAPAAYHHGTTYEHRDRMNSRGIDRPAPKTQTLDLLVRCLAVQVQKASPAADGSRFNPHATLRGRPQSSDFFQREINLSTVSEDWMYENGYLVFQAFLAANNQCSWNPALLTALDSLTYAGWASPGILLVSGSPKALDVIRAAWCRRVLRSPIGYTTLALESSTKEKEKKRKEKDTLALKNLDHKVARDREDKTTNASTAASPRMTLVSDKKNQSAIWLPPCGSFASPTGKRMRLLTTREQRWSPPPLSPC
ncbi:unnamed protein product [Cyprideis torosa]|uniref:Uncharacterized protein n=1 Tax=Cyprideis torosa TaxID=163714 RepID=A0A7R8WDA8_9CRUS|nr:unnamed protein product [Cyprideis torosa]CAG0894467.1 unnamed protein product [Cyprideis torosa]